MKHRRKLLKMKENVERVFYHKPYYVETSLAAFASRSHLCLLGYRGGGKTHLAEAIVYQMDSARVTADVQGYLSADFSDTIARFDIPSLLRGEEKVLWYRIVKARVKFFDEIQRLGVGARNALFRMMTKGTVKLGDQEEGIKDDYFWVIVTANPTETKQDIINIPLSEPLWDRFYAVLWVPMPRLTDLLRIEEELEKIKKAYRSKPIFNEEDILALWREVEQIEVPSEINYIASLMVRILQFCKDCQDYDGSSVDEAVKRALCSRCNKNYICSEIARPPSVRAKLAWLRLAKGFAYLRGSTRVEVIDLEKAFPPVFWKRIKFMDEMLIANRLKKLQELFSRLKQEIAEAKEAIELCSALKRNFNPQDYRRLEEYVNAKIWLIEVKEDLDNYLMHKYRGLKEEFEKAVAEKNWKKVLEITQLVKEQLPEQYHGDFYVDLEVEIDLTAKNIARLARISKDLFKRAREMKESGEKRMKLRGEEALIVLVKGGVLGEVRV